MTFKVSYTNGNEKLFETKSMTELMKYLLENELVDYIWKIEEI